MTMSNQQEEFSVDGTQHIKEALSFLKDWVTSIISVETASIGAIAVFLEVSQETSLAITEAIFVYLAVIFFVTSIICGGFVLYMLPGSVQRKPKEGYTQNDVYSIKTLGRIRIGSWAKGFWATFLLGIISFAIFIMIRTWPA